MKKQPFPRFVWLENCVEEDGNEYFLVHEDGLTAAQNSDGSTFGLYELKETQELKLRVVSGKIKKVR